MCSIFRNRIEYRRSIGDGGCRTPEKTSTKLAKNFEPDRNNNDGQNSLQKVMSVKSQSPDTAVPEDTSTTKIPQRPTSEKSYQCQQDDDSSALDLSMLPHNLTDSIPQRNHVALDTLHHTKVAVAQLAASALVSSQQFGNDSSPNLAALFNAQRQHFMQLHFIQQLQSQLERSGNQKALQSVDDEEQAEDYIDTPVEKTLTDNLHRLESGELDLSQKRRLSEEIVNDNKNPVGPMVCGKELTTKTDRLSAINSDSCKEARRDAVGGQQIQLLMGDISSSLASSIITNHDPPPAPNEPNCLEMLQRRTEEVLDSASQSLHASQMQDEYEYGNSKDGQSRGEIFKHRCKYCGKIFGSFSALQIHLRSHTGERPFQCNVCGSKFTTKGNLKVHYQRHTQIYPTILLPPEVKSPLLQVHGEHPQSGLGHGNSSLKPISASNLPLSLAYNDKSNLDKAPSLPEDSSEDTKDNANQNTGISKHTEIQPHFVNSQPASPVAVGFAGEPEEEPEDLSKSSACAAPEPKDTRETKDAKPLVQVKSPELLMEKCSDILELPEKSAEQPLTSTQTLKRSHTQRKRNASSSGHQSSHRKSASSAQSMDSENGDQNLAKIFRRSSFSRNSASLESHQPVDYGHLETYVDKSWEDLIEIDTTPETSKLQQLVDNIENKLTDPNQCIFCQKVMSCRSSLQMHIRTHTGERPFRCKICGRAFATKGNLKAHMSIHKIKPPMRSQFKCPVCHQKFSNGIILQQHIRIHTIDDGLGAGLAGISGNPSDLVTAMGEHAIRLRNHVESSALEDQNSNKSIGTSENLDISTTSEYSGQRSESESQCDFDEYLTMESTTDDSRENSFTASMPPHERVSAQDLERDVNVGSTADGVGGPRQRSEGECATAVGATAVDLTSTRLSASLSKQQTHFDHLPHMLGFPPNFWLMAAAREELQARKLPLLPFASLNFMGKLSRMSTLHIPLLYV